MAKCKKQVKKTPPVPNKGTIAHKVWVLCADITDRDGAIPDRASVLLAAAKHDLNPSTVSICYAAWKKHRNATKPIVPDPPKPVVPDPPKAYDFVPDPPKECL